jgi:adenylate cyclase
VERKLAAILCADVYGYSRLMGEDEEATLRTLTSYRKLIDSQIEQHRGRFVNSAGDSVLAEFASVVEAVNCAVDIQTGFKAENASIAPERRMEFRIGVNLGDVMVEGAQIYGDGVNVAARLESLAEPGGICISRTVHENIRKKLPLSFEDLGEQAVKNIAEPVRVYRVLLNGAVAAPQKTQRIARKYRRAGALSFAGLAIAFGTIVLVQHVSLKPQPTHASIPPQETPALPLPDNPSIAVLPFTNLSGDPKQEYFSDGITDDLVTDLSRLPGLFVIDRNSTFAYKGKPTRAQEIGRELGVKYVLEGSARRASDWVRINVQLVDASTGDQVWGQRYDKQLRDIFRLQDEIVQSLIATLNLQLPLLEKGYVVPQRTNNLEAYDYFLRGFEYFLNLNPQDGVAKVRTMFEKAIELDPRYADAYANLGMSYVLSYLWQWEKDPGLLDRAAELANKSIALDDSESLAYSVRGWVAAVKGERDNAIADSKRAVLLDPNSAFACVALADINEILLLNSEEALTYAQKAIRLDPRHPENYLMQEGVAYNNMRRYAEAVDALKKAKQNNPWVHVHLVYTYSELGREQEARAEVAEVLRISPGFSVEQVKQIVPRNWQEPGVQRFLADLRKAGLK